MKKIFTSEDKARIALLAHQGLKLPSAIASANHAHPIQVGLWKQKLIREAHTIFDIEHSDTKRILELTTEMDELHRIIGVRDAELVWLKKRSGT
jgi:transposase-like protein